MIVALIHDPVISQRSHLSILLYWGLSFQHMSFGRHIKTIAVGINIVVMTRYIAIKVTIK
jgi:hypothetical protein